jgi:UDP-GlcNAc3NAcA epimerase
LRIVTIVGARPQFIKAAAVSRAIASHNRAGGTVLEEQIVHTGQHYDANLSQTFFEELEIPEPRYNLGIGSLSQGAQTGRMLEALEEVLVREKPQWVLVYGDTNSTLAGALAAKKLGLPLAHVEAGLRSFNLRMAEEINRIVADRISDLLLCPTETAVANLRSEGITSGVEQVGDVMYDASLFYRDQARQRSSILARLRLAPKEFVLATIHRAENTDDAGRLRGILEGLARVAQNERVVLPLHPRTREWIKRLGLADCMGKIEVLEPVSYLDMICLEEAARLICTDSGGVQKEAFFFRVPCVTLRDETEWVETVQSGWNRLADAKADAIVEAIRESRAPDHEPPLFYGDGQAADRIVKILEVAGGGRTPDAAGVRSV